MQLYHGSTFILQNPQLGKGSPHNDYGQGFYCTEHMELAREWACKDGHDGFVNRYELDVASLKVLHLNEPPFSLLHWLTVLLENRIVRYETPLMEQAASWLVGAYHIDLAEYDAIIGYRADDSYFAFARAFLGNSITLGQLEQAMHLGELGLQFVLKSERAFKKLRFVDAEPASSADYYPLSIGRDIEARTAYRTILLQDCAGQPTIRDLMNDGPDKSAQTTEGGA